MLTSIYWTLLTLSYHFLSVCKTLLLCICMNCYISKSHQKPTYIATQISNNIYAIQPQSLILFVQQIQRYLYNQLPSVHACR